MMPIESVRVCLLEGLGGIWLFTATEKASNSVRLCVECFNFGPVLKTTH